MPVVRHHRWAISPLASSLIHYVVCVHSAQCTQSLLYCCYDVHFLFYWRVSHMRSRLGHNRFHLETAQMGIAKLLPNRKRKNYSFSVKFSWAHCFRLLRSRKIIYWWRPKSFRFIIFISTQNDEVPSLRCIFDLCANITVNVDSKWFSLMANWWEIFDFINILINHKSKARQTNQGNIQYESDVSTSECDMRFSQITRWNHFTNYRQQKHGKHICIFSPQIVFVAFFSSFANEITKR